MNKENKYTQSTQIKRIDRKREQERTTRRKQYPYSFKSNRNTIGINGIPSNRKATTKHLWYVFVDDMTFMMESQYANLTKGTITVNLVSTHPLQHDQQQHQPHTHSLAQTISKQANKQTNKQANKQTSKQANKQTNKR